MFIFDVGHSWLAELWRLGHDPLALTACDAVADAAIRTQLDYVYGGEGPSLVAALGMAAEAPALSRHGDRRFRNPFLDHRLGDIFDNYEAKKQPRFGGPIELAATNGMLARQPRLRAALALNGWAGSTFS